MVADAETLTPSFRWPGILGALEALRRAVPGRGKAATDPALAEVSRAALAVGPTVLAAESKDDLLEAADEVIQSDAFAEARLALLKLARSAPLSSFEELPDTPEPNEDVVAALGEGPAYKFVAELAPILRGSASATLQLLSGIPDAALYPGVLDLTSHLMDERIPIEVRRLLLDAARGDAFGLGIVAAVDRSKRLEPWLALALVENVINSERSRLRILASLPGVALPTEVVPADQRLDVRALEQFTQSVDNTVERWSAEADATGEDPYFPLGAPDDGQE